MRQKSVTQVENINIYDSSSKSSGEDFTRVNTECLKQGVNYR